MLNQLRRRPVVCSSIILLLVVLCILPFQAAFINAGQEFGAYGQYNRVLRVITSMDDYTILGHRVHRKLELVHIFQVEDFSITLRDKAGRSAAIAFSKGSPEMTERDDAALQTLVRTKFDQTVTSRGKL